MPDQQGYYALLVHRHPGIRDRSEDREPLLRPDGVLDAPDAAGVRAQRPRTWRLEVDSPLPAGLHFPLFVRTATTSWKPGGRISRVRNVRELEAEAGALRRAFGRDATILARAWLDLAGAGPGVYGPVPQEVRVWVVDGEPFAWSFHDLNVLRRADGFPPSAGDLPDLCSLSRQVGSAFRSRLAATDFARLARGGWGVHRSRAGELRGDRARVGVQGSSVPARWPPHDRTGR